jgi:hypothetical protein
MIELDRPPWARLLSGFRLQGLIALFTVLLAARAIGQAAGAIDSGSPPLGGTLLATLAFLLVLLVGATGHAEADEAGVRWRYYAPHSYRWDEIERIELQVVGVGITGVRHLIGVRAGGRTHRITPAAEGGAGRARFGRALAELAAARGVEVVDRWR